MVFKPLSGSFQLRTLHCRATLICASFGGLIIYYHFLFMLMKGNKCSISRIFEVSDNFPYAKCAIGVIYSCLLFIMKVIIRNFSEDRDVGILYLSTKFELDRSIDN